MDNPNFPVITATGLSINHRDLENGMTVVDWVGILARSAGQEPASPGTLEFDEVALGVMNSIGCLSTKAVAAKTTQALAKELTMRKFLARAVWRQSRPWEWEDDGRPRFQKPQVPIKDERRRTGDPEYEIDPATMLMAAALVAKCKELVAQDPRELLPRT